MNVAYINISKSEERDIIQLRKRQINSVLYKESLCRHMQVHYLLRNSRSFKGYSSELRICARNLSVPVFILFVLRYIIRNKISVIIIHNLDHFLYVPVFKLIPGLKVIMQHHGEKSYLRKKAVLMKLADRFLDGYFFHGSGNAAPFADKNCLSLNKVIEVPEGTTYFTPGAVARSAGKKIIFIGRLDENKNLLLLLKALNMLRHIEWILSIYYSDNALFQPLKSYCESNMMSDRVRFEGKVPQPEIQNALQQSDIFVSCSRYEAGGYSLIEALACGVYPVVSRIAPFDFLLRDLKFKKQFDPSDENELAECLLEVLNADINMQIRTEIRGHFEKYASPEAIAKCIMKALDFLQTGK